MNRRRARPILALLNVEARERQEGDDGSNIPGLFVALGNTRLNNYLPSMLSIREKRVKESFKERIE